MIAFHLAWFVSVNELQSFIIFSFAKLVQHLNFTSWLFMPEEIWLYTWAELVLDFFFKNSIQFGNKDLINSYFTLNVVIAILIVSAWLQKWIENNYVSVSPYLSSADRRLLLDNSITENITYSQISCSIGSIRRQLLFCFFFCLFAPSSVLILLHGRGRIHDQDWCGIY